MTEQEKMLLGKLYKTNDPTLAAAYQRAGILSKKYNDTFVNEQAKRVKILKELLPHLGKNSVLRGPIWFDYGKNTYIGDNCYANYNFTVLDCAHIKIGDDVFFGPNCTLAPPVHPLLSDERKMKTDADGSLYDMEYAKPITIQDGCWLASNVTVCGGVTIGKNSVIGAGSVVTRDIPENVFAAGNPCKIIRQLTEQDSVQYKKELF